MIKIDVLDAEALALFARIHPDARDMRPLVQNLSARTRKTQGQSAKKR